MTQKEIIPHLFRTEYSKITAVLCKLFGIGNIEIAEDIASEAFLAAVETWPYRGIPPNPVAWLYTVAKNKAINYIRQHQLFDQKIGPWLKRDATGMHEPEVDLSARNITDSQLQMLFAVCHPAIAADAQTGLALRILCGFGIEEIANAFLTNKETINKRLYRAKEKLRAENIAIEFPPDDEINERLDAVLTTIYLLFNEGYYSESEDGVVRKDLCAEAMRLARLLIDNEQTNLPMVNALFSLMSFHASRFDARKNEKGELVLYHDQDEHLWDQALISQGAHYLHQASRGSTASKYHLEAAIAYWHTIKNDSKEKWESILKLFDQLLEFEYSPVTELNRIYALSRVTGKAVAIEAAEKLNLSNNHFYYTLLGDLYEGVDNLRAKINLEKALLWAKTNTDRSIIQSKIERLAFNTIS